MNGVQATLSLLGFALLSLACSPSTRAPKSQTQSSLKNAHYTMAVLENETHKTIGQLLKEVPRGNSLQEKWRILVGNVAAQDRIDPQQLQKTLCVDGFERLFNIEFKTNLIAAGASTNLTGSIFDVVIWSSGYNGTNELGRGDDIYLKPADMSK